MQTEPYGAYQLFSGLLVCFTHSHMDVGIRFLADNHIAWVLSSWQICINRLPLLNEQVKISTWAYGMKAFYGYRNFTLEDAGGSTLHMPILSGCLLIHEPADR